MVLLNKKNEKAKGPVGSSQKGTLLLLGIGLVLGAVGIIGDGGFLIKPIMDVTAAA